MRTADLVGAYLDYFTGLADGKPPEKLSIRRVPRTGELICVYNVTVRYAPSTDPERFVGMLRQSCVQLCANTTKWSAIMSTNPTKGFFADDPLIAFCRAKVSSVYGPEVPDIEITE